eukprot:15461039-Alexandrium_andersonii.AAC.1
MGVPEGGRQLRNRQPQERRRGLLSRSCRATPLTDWAGGPSRASWASCASTCAASCGADAGLPSVGSAGT